MSLGFYVDVQRCIGCRTCQVACKDRHNLQAAGPRTRRVGSFECGMYPEVGMFHLTVSCNHCDDPACVAGCPTGAMFKSDDGTVQHVDDCCVVCRNCMITCPYGAPQFDPERKKMTKCDFCRDYLEQGLPPSCVAACPCRALDYGEYDELLKRYGEQATIAPLPGPELTRPHFICAPNRHSKPQGSTEGLRGKRISNPEEV